MRQRILSLEAGLSDQLKDVQFGEGCGSCPVTRRVVTINSIPFDVLNEGAFSAAIGQFANCGNSHVIHFLAAHPTVVARQVPRYGKLLRSSDLIVSDGAPIALLMRLKRPGARRVTSTDGFLRVCSDGLSCGLRHYFVGGADEGVKYAMRKTLRGAFPGIAIVGFTVPPFRAYTDNEFAEVVSRIKASDADVVWVGLGAPKQELLAHRFRSAGVAPAIITIGATFDFVANRKPRAPRLVRAIGLEWLFRVILEPRRLWRRYLFGNAQFIAGVIGDGLRGVTRRRIGNMRRPAQSDEQMRHEELTDDRNGSR